MKKFRNKGFIAFTIIGLLAVYGQQAFAFSPGQFIKEDSGDRLLTQTYQNTEGLLFQEISFGNASEYSEDTPGYHFGGGAQTNTDNFHFRTSQRLKKPTAYLQDHRNDLRQKIFPFHFFW
ncbi:hypothetical protein [Salegentibacter sediminis]|uniref:hypothetical protein n=1 Tax=Salegentibacter sediminis TaxID=1930251 RepID=UPI0009BE1225|nr:hypothetical protein [Salegentibacter sediminis]